MNAAEILSEYYHRTSLGEFPTPVTQISLPGVSAYCQTWVKRDDLSSHICGGNKTRKLEFLLRKESRPVLTFGPRGSHHVCATARHARAIGRATTAVLVPQHMTPHHQLIYNNILSECETVIELSSNPFSLITGLFASTVPIVRHREWYQIVPPGGTNAHGTLGYVLGGLELGAQIDAGLLPAPATVFVPLGTGGTAVGIAIGLAMAQLRTTVVAVRVVPRMALPEVALTTLMRRTLKLIQRAGLVAPPKKDVRFRVENGFSKNYAVSTPLADEAQHLANQAGIPVETTYTAKTFAAMIHCAKTQSANEGPILFWQTFSDEIEKACAFYPSQTV